MIIFVYGENSFLAQQKVSVMREQFQTKFDSSGMNLVEFPAGKNGKIEIGDVLQAVQTPPFLSEKRMVIVRGLTATLKKADAAPWIEGLKKTPDTTILLFWDPEGAKKIEKTALHKGLTSADEVFSYNMEALVGSGLQTWAQGRAKELQLKISESQLQKVVALVGNDLWQLSGELEKLAARASSETVSDEMITDLVKANFEDQIFAFIDAISQRKPKEALRLLEEQRASGSSDFQLFSMIARQIRILLGCRSMIDENAGVTKQDVAKELGVHPFVAQKSLAQAKGFSIETLERLHGLVFDYDAQMKRSKISVELAVDRLVAEMAQG